MPFCCFCDTPSAGLAALTYLDGVGRSAFDTCFVAEADVAERNGAGVHSGGIRYVKPDHSAWTDRHAAGRRERAVSVYGDHIGLVQGCWCWVCHFAISSDDRLFFVEPEILIL